MTISYWVASVFQPADMRWARRHGLVGADRGPSVMNWYCFNLETELKKSPELERKTQSALVPFRREETTEKRHISVDSTPEWTGSGSWSGSKRPPGERRRHSLKWSAAYDRYREKKQVGGGVCRGLTRAPSEASSRWAPSVRPRCDWRCTRPPF